MNAMQQYLVRHERYERQGLCRVLVQEWEDKHWLPNFYAIGQEEYVNGDPMHLAIIEAIVERQ